MGAEEDPGTGLVKVLLLLFYSLTAVERLKTQGNWTAYAQSVSPMTHSPVTIPLSITLFTKQTVP